MPQIRAIPRSAPVRTMTPVSRVLVIENDAVARIDLCERLSCLGYLVVGAAPCAESAFRLFHADEPDLALIDILLDGERDGVTVAGILREEAPNLAIVFITSHADPLTVKRASLVQPQGYLVKPFGPDALFAAAETALAQRGGRNWRHQTVADAVELACEPAFPGPLRKRLIDFIDRNFNRNLSVAELAGHTDLGLSVFSARFRATFGVTPLQLVIERRIEESKRLLKTTSWSIREISEAVGFESQAYFATQFRERVGVPPRDFRRI